MKQKKIDRWHNITKGLLVLVLIFPLLGDLFTSIDNNFLYKIGLYIKSNKDYYATAFSLMAAILISKSKSNLANKD